MKKVIFILLAIILVACTFSSYSVIAEGRTEVSPEERTVAFFNALDEGDWNKLLLQFCSSARTIYDGLLNEQANHDNNVGILTTDSVKIKSMNAVDKAQTPHYYEIEDYFEMPGSICCYSVEADITVKEFNGYFDTGVSIFTVVLVKEGGEWLIGAVHSEPQGQRGVGYGFISYSSKPSTIVARDENNNISTVSFDALVFNATCNEIGNMGYSTAAIKANVMAVKMFSWWAQKGHYRDSLGCDIIYGDVAYMSVNLASTSGQSAVQSAMTSINKLCMVSSSGTGGKLFSSNYLAGSYNGNYQGSGILRQNGSSYLANNGYTWEQILHYYYDNSTYNHPNCGIVQIKCITHSYGAYVYDYNYHWRVCSYCGAESHHLMHNWVQHGSYDECSVCGDIRFNTRMKHASFPACI